MRTKYMLFLVGVLFATECMATEQGYTSKDRREMTALVKLSALGDKHFCKVFVCKHNKRTKTLREIPDIILDAQKAACKRLENQ